MPVRWNGPGVGIARGTCRGIDDILRTIFVPLWQIPRLGDMGQDGGFGLAGIGTTDGQRQLYTLNGYSSVAGDCPVRIDC